VIQIGAGLPPVDEQPLDHLVACHDRILDRLRTLERVGETLEAQPEPALAALSNALHFLETSGRLHTLDEEESVFPRMRRHLTHAEQDYLDSLEAQHREKEQVYSDLRALASNLRQGITSERVVQYRQLAHRLAELYRTHIESENTILVALGKRCLDTSELAVIRSEMKARRSVSAGRSR
jgi:hemerythrin-like domain-containing protein